LIGGNLSVFVTLIDGVFPANFDWSQVILFIEDVGEAPYRIGMLSQGYEML
jgi:muramoyltetrapeptide carboxypeptidase LdcA involved in peptidoglycan recycling